MDRTATVFGGTGFLGSRIVERLAQTGWEVRVAVRRPERSSARERVSSVRADIRDDSSVALAVQGASAVVNAVSLYLEKGGGPSFRDIHEDGAERIARLASASGAARLVHISGIGADARSHSRFIGARGRGEDRVKAAFAQTTVIRPSIMFGDGDRFLNSLAGILHRSPVFPLIGANTRLQPVWADDVAEAAATVLSDDERSGPMFELGGPQVLTMHEIVDWLQRLLHLRRPVVPVPIPLALAQARLLELLPSPPLTVAQVELLDVDNVVGAHSPGFAALGIQPAAMEQIAPTYVSTRQAASPRAR